MNPKQGGFTYLEVLLAVVVLAGAVTSAAFALGQTRNTSTSVDQAAVARYLLQDGVSWLRSLARIDDTDAVFGIESGEKVVDDVDDLDGRSENPPTDRVGTTFTNDWRRTWTVDSVSLTDPQLVVADGSTALMRIRIEILYLGTSLASETLLIARTP